MSKNITIIDPHYKEWIKELSLRYRKSQIKAAVKVNSEMIGFYWSLGKDIVEKQYDNHYGSSFYKNLSADLRKELANVEGLSERNIRYMKAFYSLYCQYIDNLPQYCGRFWKSNCATTCGRIVVHTLGTSSSHHRQV